MNTTKKLIACAFVVLTFAGCAGGMRDDERLRRHRVLLHQVRDAGVGVDDDLVGQAHALGGGGIGQWVAPALVEVLFEGELFLASALVASGEAADHVHTDLLDIRTTGAEDWPATVREVLMKSCPGGAGR